MSSSYKEKLIKHFLEDVKKTPTDFLISKDLPDCTLEEIEWVIEIIGELASDPDSSPDNIAFTNENEVELNVYILDVEKRSIEKRLVKKYDFTKYDHEFVKKHAPLPEIFGNEHVTGLPMVDMDTIEGDAEVVDASVS